MSVLKEAVEKKRQELIELLISAGVYEVNNRQLYELTLTELQDEFRKVDRNGVQST